MLLDASALIALYYQETGNAIVRAAVSEGAAINTANLCEVASRLLDDGVRSRAVSILIDSVNLDVILVNQQVAMLAAEYRSATRHIGLSLGDRLCLATAKLYGLPALTADQAWRTLEIPNLTVEFIR